VGFLNTFRQEISRFGGSTRTVSKSNNQEVRSVLLGKVALVTLVIIIILALIVVGLLLAVRRRRA
jgi:hypothetical protein